MWNKEGYSFHKTKDLGPCTLTYGPLALLLIASGLGDLPCFCRVP